MVEFSYENLKEIVKELETRKPHPNAIMQIEKFSKEELQHLVLFYATLYEQYAEENE